MDTKQAAQIVLEVSNNKKLSGAVATADMELWQLCMRGINSPSVRPQIQTIASRVVKIANEFDVSPNANSLASW